MAVDAAGNVYIADNGDNAIKECNPATQQVTTLALRELPYAVAVDASGKVYFTETDAYAIKVYNPSTEQVSTLVSSGLAPPAVWPWTRRATSTSPTPGNAIMEYVAATSQVVTLVPGLNAPLDVAADASGNVYIADTMNFAIKERPRAFVPAARSVKEQRLAPIRSCRCSRLRKG